MKPNVLIKKSAALTGLMSNHWIGALQIILGSLFIGLSGQIAFPLPFTPVPVSMQTLAVSLLAISLGPRKAVFSVLAFLCQATLGLPVLAKGLSNPLWMVSPTVGYLLGFIPAAFVIGNLMESHKSSSFFKNWLMLSLNEGIIITLGATCLGFFVGWENAFFLGVLPFIPGTILKITMAASSIKPIDWLKSK